MNNHGFSVVLPKYIFFYEIIRLDHNFTSVYDDKWIFPKQENDAKYPLDKYTDIEYNISVFVR